MPDKDWLDDFVSNITPNENRIPLEIQKKYDFKLGDHMIIAAALQYMVIYYDGDNSFISFDTIRGFNTEYARKLSDEKLSLLVKFLNELYDEDLFYVMNRTKPFWVTEISKEDLLEIYKDYCSKTPF